MKRRAKKRTGPRFRVETARLLDGSVLAHIHDRDYQVDQFRDDTPTSPSLTAAECYDLAARLIGAAEALAAERVISNVPVPPDLRKEKV